MSLPNAWIDRIFDRCLLVYGRDFLARWEGMDIAAVKADWAEHLAGFEHRGGSAIAYALDHLPERAPSVVEFARIARGGPFATPGQPALGVPRVRGPNEDERAALRELGAMLKTLPKIDDRAWAATLIRRHETGEHRATPVALAMAREALETGADSMWGLS